MKITIDLDAKLLLREIFENWPEAQRAGCLTCTGWDYDKFRFEFVDEDDKTHVVTMARALTGFKIFLELYLAGKLPGLDITNLQDSSDYNWTCADNIVQCAIYGEVIYG